MRALASALCGLVETPCAARRRSPQVRRFPDRSIPATGRLAALSVDHSGYTLALALGGAW
jgi:hypothetical protein